MDFHLSLGSAFLCVGFILRWVVMGGVKVVQLCTEPCHFLAESVSVLTITAKVSRLILIGWDSGASRLAGLDHMHTPWSCEGLESAVPQLHGQRPRELRFPPQENGGLGRQNQVMLPPSPLQTLFLPAAWPWASSLASFCHKGPLGFSVAAGCLACSSGPALPGAA